MTPNLIWGKLSMVGVRIEKRRASKSLRVNLMAFAMGLRYVGLLLY